MTKEQVKREAVWSFLRALTGALWLAAGAVLHVNRVPGFWTHWTLFVGAVVSAGSVATLFLARLRIRRGIHD